jgi:hypothetical protein
MAGSAVSGTRRKQPLPEIGTRSGQLTVTGYIQGERHGLSALVVRCSCGRPEFSVALNNFKHFRSTRCGICGRRAGHEKRYWIYENALPDVAHRSRLLNRLAAAITRCHSPSSRIYASYGGRGIFVCDEWRNDRSTFLRYIQTIPGWDDPSLDMDRTDNNRGYEPGNIRFATHSQNALNRRKINEMEERIRDLEARLRSGERGTEASLHDPDWF